MTLLNDWADKTLIDELKKRGYKVIKDEFIRNIGVSESVSMEMENYRNREDYVRMLNSVYENLGRRAGHFLMTKGAIPVQKFMDEKMGWVRYEAQVTVIVSDPEFDRPYPLTLNK